MNTYQLKHQAKLLHDTANEMLRLAGEIEAMPDPVGPAIADVITILARHGLAVISRAALADIAELLTNVEAEDDEPWPAGFYASMAAMRETLDRTTT